MTNATPDRPSGASRLARLGIAIGLVVLIVGYSAYFQIPEGSGAVVTRFGNPVREILAPGPYAKLPWPIDQVHPIDLRKQVFNTPYTATFTKDRKNVVVLAYVVWRVEQPLRFLQAVGSLQAGASKLDGMVTAAKNVEFGNHELTALVSTDADTIKTDAIDQAILEQVRGPAQEKFGIVVDQVGIKRIAYPEENVAAVLAQMRAERVAEADRLREEGTTEANRIRDDARVEAEQILRSGRQEAGRIRAKAESEAAAIYAAVRELDPSFYRYWRSLEAVKATLGAKATIIMTTEQGFFDVLSPPTEKAPPDTPSLEKQSISRRGEP
ncbi:protease modulator HflC [Kolteria novifilia]